MSSNCQNDDTISIIARLSDMGSTTQRKIWAYYIHEYTLNKCLYDFLPVKVQISIMRKKIVNYSTNMTFTY